MAISVQLTSERQATLPKELCDEMQVGPGDRLTLQRRVIDGETVWIMRPERERWAWVGSLKHAAAGRSHDMAEIRRSIERGRHDSERSQGSD